jgi:hypothetical protein
VTGRYRWYAVAWIGLVVAAILHGLNDWGRVNGHPLWILVVLVSGILLLGLAKVGSRGDLEVLEGWPSALRLHGTPAGHAPAAPGGQPGGTSAQRTPQSVHIGLLVRSVLGHLVHVSDLRLFVSKIRW